MDRPIVIRPRRLRAHSSVRSLVAETEVAPRHLIQPYFLSEVAEAQEPISGFTGISRWGIDSLTRRIESDLECGVRSFLLFGQSSKRDDHGSEAASTESTVATALQTLRKRLGREPVLYADVCLCSYTSHGHCGILGHDGVDNDKTLEHLADVAALYASAGADFVAPSDMMDGRVGKIRSRLDRDGLVGVGILAYTAKYSSNYYGPFRHALDSTPQGFDRAGYQMDFRNRSEALRELELDLEEGADMVMVKPALAYLDIIAEFSRRSSVPVVAYSTSGEYQMVKLGAQAGMVQEEQLVVENLVAIRRAGAKAIITYFASEAAQKGWL